jgi:hypothetical protein
MAAGALLQRRGDLWCRREVHVRYPQRDNVWIEMMPFDPGLALKLGYGDLVERVHAGVYRELERCSVNSSA